MTKLLDKLWTVRPAVAGGVGFVAEGISLGLFHGTALAVATAIVGVATTLGIYAAPRTPLTPKN